MSDTTRCVTHHRACDCIEADHAAEVARLTAEREDMVVLADKQNTLNERLLAHVDRLTAERDELRKGIEAHKFRKAERRCYPMPGHEGKYGCLDHDMRLWSLLDR